MAAVAHLDFETRSTTDLKKSGVHRYAEDKHTAPWGFSFRMDDGAMRRWKEGDPLPEDLVQHIREGGWVIAHGSMFERTIWNEIIVERLFPDAPPIVPEQQSCTMGRALAMALPADLERLATVLGVPHQKDMEGAALLRKMMRPRRVNPDGTIVWWNEPDKIERLALYCDGDVYAESDADKAIPWLTQSEQELWVLDQKINDRGVKVDVAVIRRAVELVEYAKKRADWEMAKLTNGYVKKCSEVGKIVDWLNGRGIPCQTLRKGDQDDLITLTEIYDDATAKSVIELRRTAGKTSIAKYAKFLECVCRDGRVRGLLAYHGASTGRWAGRLVQPQNFPRVDAETEADYVAFVIQLLLGDMLLGDVYDLIELVGPPKSPIGERVEGVATLSWLSKSLRSCIICEPGNKLVGGDYSNIEGRITAWLSNEQWKIEAFRAYDEGRGHDLYKLSYASSFGVAVEDVTKPLRQIGKVEELALGFQGGVGAFITMTQTYMVKLHKIVEAVKRAVPAEEWDTYAARYEHARDRVVYTRGGGRVALSQNEWTACKIVVTRWRKAHPMITAGWKELQDAAIQAVSEPNSFVPVYSGRVRYMCDGHYLYCALPGGRVLSYPTPSLGVERKEVIYDGQQWLDCNDLALDYIAALERLGYKVRTFDRYHVSVWGIDGTTNQWTKSALYGGYQCENIVQGTARDVLKPAMLRAEAYGYTLVLTVHDELLCEVPKAFGSAEHFAQVMSVPEPWMAGLPVAAAAWEDVRYVK